MSGVFPYPVGSRAILTEAGRFPVRLGLRRAVIVAALLASFLVSFAPISQAAQAPASQAAGETAALKLKLQELESRAKRAETLLFLGVGLATLLAAAVAYLVARMSSPAKTLEADLQRAVETLRQEKEKAARFSLFLMDGLKEFEQENYEAALKASEEALELDSRSPVAWTIKGVSLLRTAGRTKESLEALEEALALDPRLVLALTAKGAALVGLDRHEEALSIFAEALEIDPRSVVALTGRGAALVLMDRHDEALSAFTQAIENDPYNAPAWAGKGVVLVNLGRPEEALSAFGEAIGLAPHYAPAWYNKACAHSKLAQKPEMLEALATAIALDASYGEKAREDQDLELYQEDPDFQELVGE